MMKILISLILALLLVGCGSNKQPLTVNTDFFDDEGNLTHTEKVPVGNPDYYFYAKAQTAVSTAARAKLYEKKTCTAKGGVETCVTDSVYDQRVATVSTPRDKGLTFGQQAFLTFGNTLTGGFLGLGQRYIAEKNQTKREQAMWGAFGDTGGGVHIKADSFQMNDIANGTGNMNQNHGEGSLSLTVPWEYNYSDTSRNGNFQECGQDCSLRDGDAPFLDL